MYNNAPGLLSTCKIGLDTRDYAKIWTIMYKHVHGKPYSVVQAARPAHVAVAGTTSSTPYTMIWSGQ